MNAFRATDSTYPFSADTPNLSDPGAHQQKPPSPPLLSSFPKCYKGSLLASPALKNLAGAMVATGAGITIGCPWLITLLIGVGVGTSWMGGVGFVIGGLGIGLWLLSTYVSMDEKPKEQDPFSHIAESIILGAVGIPVVILRTIFNGVQSCRNEPEVDDRTVKSTPEQRSLDRRAGRKFSHRERLVSENQNSDSDDDLCLLARPEVRLANNITQPHLPTTAAESVIRIS